MKNEIQFRESTSTGYRDRTVKNASADVTIAFAVDFTTGGEILTKNATIEQGKLYLKISLKGKMDVDSISDALFDEIFAKMNPIGQRQISFNIAGNGMYTLIKHDWTQKKLDLFMYRVLLMLKEKLNSSDMDMFSLRSGGQSGADESGAKAGAMLGLPTLVLAPKGWKYRTQDGIDVSDEQRFKSRFTEQLFDKGELW